MVITSVSVRGMLGPLSVWISKEDDDDELSKTMDDEDVKMRTEEIVTGHNSRATISSLRHNRHSDGRESTKTSIGISDHSVWKKIYEREHPPSMTNFVELMFDVPIKLAPHQCCGLYIHSKRPGDEAIVYDNQRSAYTHDDHFLCIRPGNGVTILQAFVPAFVAWHNFFLIFVVRPDHSLYRSCPFK